MATPANLDSEASMIWHLLLDNGLADEDQLTDCWDEHERNGVSFTQALYNYDIVEEPALLQMIADNLGTEFVDIKALNIDELFTRCVPANLARLYQILPIREESKVLYVAACDPMNFQMIDELPIVLGRQVQVCVARNEDILAAIDRFYPESVGDSMSDVLSDMASFQQEVDEETESAEALEAAASSTPIVRFVNIILYQAVKDKASDIHFEPFAEEFKIRYRIDGVLYEMTPPPKHLAIPVISRVKVVGGLNIAERRLPQDGRIEVRVAGRKIDLRVSTLPTRFGESVVLRVLDKTIVNLDLEAIGLPDYIKQTLRDVIKKPNGIILVTGPTGSGKTTTLYSCLKEVNTIEDKVLTAEDPVEFSIEGLMQVPVNEGIGMTFARALKAFLRQDPDRIMVGEVRDLITASMAVQAALTGHMVFSTLHTNDAPGAVTRLVDMGIEPFLITSTVECILAQRLVRRVCATCKTPYTPTDDELKSLGITREEVGSTQFYYGRGCPDCNNSGYKGRKGIFELFTLTAKSRLLIIKREPSAVITRQAREDGMHTLRESGVASIFTGETTVEEVLKYT